MTTGGAHGPAARLRPPAPEWVLPEPPDPEVVAGLTEALKLPPAVCAILAQRGFTEVEEAKRFLRPRLEHLHDPALLADGELAAERIARAVRDGETIFVHGDYDVDGVCSAALLTRWLRGLGGEVVPFVPHRMRDGYDFGPNGLAAAREARASLVVTADCGSLAHDTVQAARDAGIDVVVTDHHAVGAEHPAATAFVNPNRADCAYPWKGLCGCGIAYKLCELVARALGVDPAPLVGYLDLVALATVADLVPLEGENRVLVHYGLRRFAGTGVAGVSALVAEAGLDAAAITAGRVGFVVAPRINAVGRMGDAGDALRLLLTDDPEEARRLAVYHGEVNGARQEEDRRTLDEALERLVDDYDAGRDFGVVVAGEGWHPGVIGIVASRVVERIHRPVIMIALDGEAGRGSGRSIPGFDLHAALMECDELMLRWGGHKQAAGMDLSREALPAFRERFNEAARTRLVGETLRPRVRTDLELRLDEADLQLVHWLAYLGPHGMGNPGPSFLARGVTVEGARVVGSDHLKATLVQGSARLDAIGFGMAALHPPEEVNGVKHDVVVKLERNEWRDTVRLQARLVALRSDGAR